MNWAAPPHISRRGDARARLSWMLVTQRLLLLTLLVAVSVGCGRVRYDRREDANGLDALGLDAPGLDAQVEDAAGRDAAAPDAWSNDTDSDVGEDAFNPTDADLDAFVPDAAMLVATDDAGMGDAGMGDASVFDAGMDAYLPPDAGADAGRDAGFDVGVDAFRPDAPLVNECLVANGGCNMNATCMDLPMGRSCMCNAGFSGDGVTCVPVDIGGPSALQAYIKATNTGMSDAFGSSMAMSADGNTVVVGAYEEDSSSAGVGGAQNDLLEWSGAAYVYVRSGVTWTFQAFIKASNPGLQDSFGSCIALSADGNTLAVGSPFEDGSGNGVNPAMNEAAADSGAVYVYVRSGTTWAFQAYIKATNSDANDQICAVALSADGDTLAMGSATEATDATGVDPRANERAVGAGAVYVYRRSGGVWTDSGFIKASNTGSGDHFGGLGIALNGDGTTLVVGAADEDGGGLGVGPPSSETAADSGAVYVYTRVGAMWSFQQYIKAPNTGSGDAFGVSVDLSSDGSTLAVGAMNEGSSGSGVNPAYSEGASWSGAVYIYRRVGAAWSFDSFLKAANPESSDQFGETLHLNEPGTALIVGAPRESGSATGIGGAFNEGSPSSGAAYVYAYSGGSWFFQRYVKASNTDTTDAFGTAVHIADDGLTVGVSAPYEDSSTTGVGSIPNEAATWGGALYIYR